MRTHVDKIIRISYAKYVVYAFYHIRIKTNTKKKQKKQKKQIGTGE